MVNDGYLYQYTDPNNGVHRSTVARVVEFGFRIEPLPIDIERIVPIESSGVLVRIFT